MQCEVIANFLVLFGKLQGWGCRFGFKVCFMVGLVIHVLLLFLTMNFHSVPTNSAKYCY